MLQISIGIHVYNFDWITECLPWDPLWGVLDEGTGGGVLSINKQHSKSQTTTKTSTTATIILYFSGRVFTRNLTKTLL